MALAIGMGIGIPFPASSIGQAINYATTWPFADTGLTGTPWADVRRTGTATYIDSAGLVATLPDLGGGTYAARITHDPSTLARLGMLVEGQRTQLLGQVDNLAGSEWSRSAVNAPTAAAQYRGRDTWSITRSASGFATIYQALGTLSAAAHICRIYVWADTATVATAGFYAYTTGFGNLTYTKVSGPGSVSGGSGTLVAITGLSTSTPTIVDLKITPNGTEGVDLYIGHTSGSSVGSAVRYQIDNVEAGSNATSYIPNSGTGTVVRVADSAGPGLALTSTALSAAFPGGVTAAFTGVIKYRKAYSVSSNETVFALSAGSSAGTTNLFALRTNGTQAQLVTSAGAGTLSGTLVHDGSTVNRIAYSCDPSSGKMSISVNGAASVETTGIAYTGAGVAALIAGSQTYAGSEAMGEMIISEWDNSRTSYITGASLQALSA